MIHADEAIDVHAGGVDHAGRPGCRPVLQSRELGHCTGVGRHIPAILEQVELSLDGGCSCHVKREGMS